MSDQTIHFSWVKGLGIAIASTTILYTNHAIAQITPDNTLPNNSQVRLDGTTSIIEGGTTRGTNLFHSFQEFSVVNNTGALFNNAANIQNILTRVTGNSISRIDGLISANGTANLFLLNPNGIVFGPNAQLNLGGSFFASTANAIKFAGGFEFNTNGSQTTPLLTVNVPIGLQYGMNPRSIQVQGSNLQVGAGQTLALIGGNVSMSGGQLFAGSGRIELGGLTAPGLVELHTNSLGKIQNLNFPVGVQRADVELTNGAQVLVTGVGGGNIAVNIRNLNLLNRSSLNAGITNNAGTSDTIAGDIDVKATGIITLRDSSLIQNIINPGATGNAGKINIVADSLNLLSGSQLFSFTSGLGNAGEVNVRAANTVSLDSAGNNASTSGIINSVDLIAEGNAGNINITTGSLTVSNGAQLNTITSGQGNAGAVNIRAANTVTFDGANVGASGIISAVATTGVGKGGDINITAGSVAVTKGAQLNAITRNEGDAGNVNINARDTVLIDGENPNSINDPYAGVSSIFTSVSIDDQGRQARGNGGDIKITTGSLLMTNGGQLNAITRGVGNAGNVNINARDAVTLDGERRISSTRAASAIFTSVDGNEYSGFPTLGTAIGNGGDITITTGRLAITRGAALSALTKGQGNAGNVTIHARDTVTLDGENSNRGASGIFSSVDSNLYTTQPPAIGDGGGVKITTGSLTITRGAGVFATTQGQGNAGDVTIHARDAVTIDGENSKQGSSGVFSSVEANLDSSTKPVAIGNGGNVVIDTGTISLTRGGGVYAITQGQGNAGDVTINARDTVNIDGENSKQGSSGIFSSVNANSYTTKPAAIGNGGNVVISAGTLSLTKGGGVFTTTEGQGNAGDVTIHAHNTITIDGENSKQGSSGIFSSVEGNLYSDRPSAIGNGGKVVINTGTLSLTNGGGVFTTNEGQGNAGDVTIHTRDTVTIDGENSQKGSSGVYSSVAANLYSDRPSAIGNGGNIGISTDLLSVTNGGGLFATTAGRGDAGNVNINTRQALFDGVSSRGRSSGIFSNVESTAVGNGRNINITARNLTVRNDGKLSTNSEGNGSAGNIVVDSNSILLDKGFLSSDTVAAEGNIILRSQGLILRRNSQITTNARGENIIGGNIKINTDVLAAIENSDISANSINFRGGNVNITTQGIFGIRFRNAPTLESDITATGANSQLNGTVQINTPDVDPNNGLVELPIEGVDASSLISQNFCAVRGGSSFTITGRGGLPPSPNEALNANAVWEDWELTAVATDNRKNQHTPVAQGLENATKIVPAQGWVRNEQGEVTLVAAAPTATPHGLKDLPSFCQAAN